jgi:hypothetical protein
MYCVAYTREQGESRRAYAEQSWSLRHDRRTRTGPTRCAEPVASNPPQFPRTRGFWPHRPYSDTEGRSTRHLGGSVSIALLRGERGMTVRLGKAQAGPGGKGPPRDRGRESVGGLPVVSPPGGDFLVAQQRNLPGRASQGTPSEGGRSPARRSAPETAG